MTRDDGVLSVRAGFVGNELGAAWPGDAGAWRLDEYDDGLFTHCFCATRRGGRRHEDALRRRHRRRRAGRRERGDPARARRLVGGADRAAGVSAPQGLRRVRRGEQPARCSTRSASAPSSSALAGAELRRVALMRGGDTIVAALPAADGAAHRWGRALGREHLDTLLADAAEAAGATRLQPWALQSIDGSAGAFRLRVRPLGDGAATSSSRAGLVVAAHGSWEPLPSERDAQRDARAASDLFAFKANFRGAAIAADLLPVLSFAGGYGGMVVADDGLATLACCVRADRLQALRAAQPGARAGDVVEAMLRRECAGVAAALGGAEREGPWLASGPLRPGVRLGAAATASFASATPPARRIRSSAKASAWRCNRRSCSPALIGPGAARLVDGATAAAAQQRALAAYEALWRRRFARRLRVAAAFAHVAMRPALAARGLAAACGAGRAC